MLGVPDWPFVNAVELAEQYGLKVMGVKGESPNLGSTQQAMQKILWSFKAVRMPRVSGLFARTQCVLKHSILRLILNP